MGCSISPILFVLAIIMEVITIADGEELPPIRAFMDDLTIFTPSPSTEAAEAILTKLNQLTARMGKDEVQDQEVKKSCSEAGKLADTHFTLCGDNIPTIQEQPVKSLGRWYTEELRDTKIVKETAQQVNGGLEAIDKSERTTRKVKTLVLAILMPRITWPLTVYEEAMSNVEAKDGERKINNYMSKSGWELLAA